MTPGWKNCTRCDIPLPPDWQSELCRQCEAMEGPVTRPVTPTHFGPVEQVAEAVPVEDSIDWLIDRMKLVPEMAQGGTEPITTRAMVLANLHQAAALEAIMVSLQGISKTLGGRSGFADLVDNLALASNKHEALLTRIADALDRLSPFRIEPRSSAGVFRHTFGQDDANLHFCRLCGLERTHPVHQ